MGRTIYRFISGTEKSSSPPYSQHSSVLQGTIPSPTNMPSSPLLTFPAAPLRSAQAANIIPKGSVPPAASSVSENYIPPPKTDTTNVMLMLISVVCVTLYVSYYLWKRRKRGAGVCSVRKLEDYSYSRLSQNEIDVDNIQFNNPVRDRHGQEQEASSGFDGADQSEENQDIQLLHDPAPALLEVEMDTTVGIGRQQTNLIIDELSDEDLLQ